MKVENDNVFTEEQIQETEKQEILKKASVGMRFWAFLIDHLIITAAVVLPSIIFAHRFDINFPMFLLLAFLLYAIKDLVKGQSPGKFILGIGVRKQEKLNNQLTTVELESLSQEQVSSQDAASQDATSQDVASQDTTSQDATSQEIVSQDVASQDIPSALKLIIRNLFVFLWFIDFFILLGTKTKIGDKLAKTDVYRLNKKPKLFIRLATLFAILALLFLAIHLVGGGTRTLLTPQEFTLRMEEQGFEVLEQLNLDNEYIEVALITTTDYFSLEYYEFSDSGPARMAFSNVQDQLERAAATVPSSHVSTSTTRASRLAITFDGNYVVISRIEHTLVIASTSSENRVAMNDLLRTLGY